MPTSSRMHRTNNHAPVGGGVPDDPPAALPKNVIAKPVRTLAVAIRIPRPLGPLA